jgi:ABC-type nitrate/sulfonate/bicarbonate transport system ATPase subunit
VTRDESAPKASRLKVSDLAVRYGNTVVVESLSLDVGNETVVLFGSSGCGKTTILKAILGTRQRGMKVSGKVTLDGSEIPTGQGLVGMVFQGPVVPSWMPVADLCRMGNRIRALPARQQETKIAEMLKRFEIGDLAGRFPYQLSGGQKQRVALAVTLLNEPQLLLLDEPTTFIDGVTRLAIWDFIEAKIRPLNIPTIIVSHDPTEAVRLGDRVAILGSPARVVDLIDIPLPHPRTGDVARDGRFWDLTRRLQTVGC